MTLTHYFPPRAASGRKPSDTPAVVQRSLDLRAGDWVEVLPLAQVMATLDEHGKLEGMPFMPEMARFCGQRFQVFKTAHKTCDTIHSFTARRLEGAVHLVGLRCDGAAHGGCQASCLMFWKEAWLRRVDGPIPRVPAPASMAPRTSTATRASLAVLERATRRDDPALGGDPRYSCQATELLRATEPLRVLDPWPWLRDISSGNLGVTTLLAALLRAVGHFFLHKQQQLRWRLFGKLRPVPPPPRLNLQPGELVRVRSKAEIMATLEDGVRNRGLSFDAEMAPLCGRTMRVLRRVERIIDEETGRMLKLRKDCIMLEDGVCTGLRTGLRRLGCPRAVYAYWREAWLQREPPQGGSSLAGDAASAQRSSAAGASDCVSNRESPHGAE